MGLKDILKKGTLFSTAKHWNYPYGVYYKHSSIKKDLILIESFHGKTISDSSLVLAKEILRLYPDKYTIYFATNNPEKHSAFIKDISLDVRLVKINTRRYVKLLATAKYIISNASLPIYFIRKEGQVYLQTWHGTPLKTLGKKMRLGIESMYNVQHNFLQASCLLFPNEFTKDVIMQDYLLENLYTGDVIMAGYPRNQVFMKEGAAESLRKELGLEDKTVYAYMPTWRGTSNTDIRTDDYLFPVRKMFRRLDEVMTDDQVFYVNFHPIIGKAFDFSEYKHIKPFPNSIDNYDFLNCADALVTDYSSVFFDFTLTKKPIILFMYDYDEYMHDRGMYMDIQSLPFRKIYDPEEFYTCIRDGLCLNDDYSQTDFWQKFCQYDSVDVPEKVIRYFFEGKKDDLTIYDYSYNKERKISVYAPQFKVFRETDLKTLERIASGKDKFVLLDRQWFVNGLSQILHDKYNDSFQYVITKPVIPRTYLEQLMFLLGSRKAVNTINARDIKRCFPQLNVGKKYISDYGYFEQGCRLTLKDAILVPCNIVPENGVMAVSFKKPDNIELKEAVFLDNHNNWISSRPLTEAEIAETRVCYDFTKTIEDLDIYNGEFGSIGILGTTSEGKNKLIQFTDPEAAAAVKQKKLLFRRVSEPLIKEYSLPADYSKYNLRILMNSVESAARDRLNTFDTTLVPTRIFIQPYYDKTMGRILISVCGQVNISDHLGDPGVLKNISFKKHKMKVSIFLRGWDANEITGAELFFNSSVEDISIPMEISVSEKKNGCMVHCSLVPEDDLPFKPIYWYLVILARCGENQYRLRINQGSILNQIKVNLTNSLCWHGSDNVIFPYRISPKGFRLCYRKKTEYDTTFVRFKEISAILICILAGWWMKRKKWIVIFEKFCTTAQDNSLYFFRYCMENLSKEEKNRIYYVIDKRSADYNNIKEYDSRIIQFMSLKHMIVCMMMKVCVSTDSKSHLYTWQTRPSFITKFISLKPELFLQHGVTALKRVDNLFGIKSANPMEYFVVTSKREQEIVVSEFGYEMPNVPVTGFARWDVLEDKRNPEDNMILVMPTWRSWLEDVPDEVFTESDYFRNYSTLLQSSALSEQLEKNNTRVVCYLHPKFSQYISAFKSNISSRVSYVQFGEISLNELIMQCSMLITDYSSVCWDVLYMDKPVVFYQFDRDLYRKIHGSYIDLEKDLPGDQAGSQDDILMKLDEYHRSGYRIKPEYKQIADTFFEHKDHHNCERTYDYLKHYALNR